MNRSSTVLLAFACCCCCLYSRATAQTLWASHSNPSDSTIYKLDATSGAVLDSFAGPGTFADAVEQVGDSLVVLDSSPTQRGSTVYKTDLMGNLESSFNLPGIDAEGLGILNNGNLVIGGGKVPDIFIYDENGVFQSSFQTRFDVIGVDTNGSNRIYAVGIEGIIDTYDLSGNLLGSLDSDLGVVTIALGLAYTGDSFFISDNFSGNISEIDTSANLLNIFRAPTILSKVWTTLLPSQNPAYPRC